MEGRRTCGDEPRLQNCGVLPELVFHRERWRRRSLRVRSLAQGRDSIRGSICWLADRRKGNRQFIRFISGNLRFRVNERNGLVYIRECQEHFSPSAGCAGLFRDIQPLSPEKTLVWCRALVYIRECQEHFSPPPDAQVYFATSSPSHQRRRSSG